MRRVHHEPAQHRLKRCPGTKFVLLTSLTETAAETILQKVYEIYADAVMKNSSTPRRCQSVAMALTVALLDLSDLCNHNSPHKLAVWVRVSGRIPAGSPETVKQPSRLLLGVFGCASSSTFLSLGYSIINYECGGFLTMTIESRKVSMCTRTY